ncbi:MAG: DUF1838 family protein [Rhodospirillaceae bacterium]|nr:DUF1838 family protein [Rhodospirillaceae bacterium]
MKDLSLARRHALMASAAALMAAAAHRPAQAAPAEHLAVYARVRGAPNGGTALWWISGVIYAKQPGEMAVPLFGVTGASRNTIAPRPDGGLTQTMEEAGYFTDLADGAILSRWRNPISGAEVVPEPYKMKSVQGIAPDGTVERPNSPFPVEVKGAVGRPEISGDTLWIAENFSARVALLSPARDGRPPDIVPGQSRVIDSLATFQARTADAMNPDAAFVPATLAFQETDPWFGWMGMGERQGLQLWQLKGRKLRTPDELPPPLAQRLKADYPEFL